MSPIGGHLTRCFLAGIVALLPVGGLLITVAVGWFMTRRTTEEELVEKEAQR